MAEDTPPTLEELVAQIRAAQAQEVALEQQRVRVQAQRQALEAQLAERLQILLGPDLASEGAAALAAGSPASPFAGAAPPPSGDRDLGPLPTPTPKPTPTPPHPTLTVRG